MKIELDEIDIQALRNACHSRIARSGFPAEICALEAILEKLEVGGE